MSSASSDGESGLEPPTPVSPAKLRRSLGLLVADGVCSETLGSLTGGAFLVTFALLLGASHFAIGLISSIVAGSQILQLLFVRIIGRWPRRKTFAVGAAVASRSVWVAIAFVWLLPSHWQLPVFIGLLVLTYTLAAAWKTAFAPWITELVPARIRGRYFGRRLALSTSVGAALTVVAALLIGHEKTIRTHELATFSLVFLVAAGVGIFGAWLLVHVSEPRRRHFAQAAGTPLRAPFADLRFRATLHFLASWSLATSFAAPFFTVYMLRRLELPVSVAIGFTALSQIVNLVALPTWGRLDDRYGSRAVLFLATTGFLATLLAWPLLGLVDRPVAYGLLVIIHAVGGSCAGGVTLGATTLVQEQAPRAHLTSYLATRSVTVAIPAAFAPLASGLLATWIGDRAFGWAGIDLQGLDFVFVVAAFICIYALRRLLAIPGARIPSRRVILAQWLLEARSIFVSSVAGLHHVGAPSTLTSEQPDAAASHSVQSAATRPRP